jgi:hypothetical protein
MTTHTPPPQRLFFFLLVLLNPLLMHAQTLVNKINEEHTAAATITVDFISSTRDSIGDVYVAGNTYNVLEQSEDAIIRKYQSGTGTIQWEYVYTDVSVLADFATDVYVKNNIVYVTGTSLDASTGESVVFSLLLDATDGSQLDLQKYSSAFGSYVVGASIKADGYGNYYVAGTEQSDTNDFQIFVIGYDANGGLLWETYYDSLGRYDGAVNMKFAKGNLDVIGYSGTAFSSWDFVTLKINPANGTIINRTFSANGNGNISKPVDFTTDFLGDLYVLGETALSPTNTDWKLIKYDTLFNEVWVKTFGSADSLADKPAGIAADNAGHLIVTGFTSKPDGSTDATTVRYHRNGSILWQRSIAASVAGEDAKATDLVAAAIPDTDFFICGTGHRQGDDDFFTASYDINGNLQWLKYFNDTTASQDRARDLQVDGSGLIYTSGSVTTPTDTGFVTVVYEEWEKQDVAEYDTLGNPLYVKNQVILRLNKNALEGNFIDDRDYIYGTPHDFLTTDAYNSLNQKLPINFNRSKMLKIFPEHLSSDSISITKSGDTIRVPDFYTSFLLIAQNEQINEQAVCDSLNSLFPIVRYAHLNFTGTLQGNPPNDPQYSVNQSGLADITLNPGSINVEPAWAYTTGEPWVKVGIFDAAVDGRHTDLGGNSSSFNSTKVKGWDFENSYSLEDYVTQVQGASGYSHHGTAMAGIIGTLRNNNTGIAGIAGGDVDDQANNGATLYGCRVLDEVQTWIDAYTITRAIFNTTVAPASQGEPYWFGLDIMNNSYSFVPYPLPLSSPLIVAQYNKIILLRDAVHYANRVGVVFVASRGAGHNNALTYPACYNDDWVINVGGSDLLGSWDDDNSNPRNIGGGIDIVAPSVSSLCRTLYYNAATNSSIYANTSGTSASAAYVSGVSALLLSYLNDSAGLNFVLLPEDVENILEFTAFPIAGYSSEYVGAGRLNAGGALEYVDRSTRRLSHLDNQMSSTNSFLLLDTSVAVKLAEPLTSFSSINNYQDTAALYVLDTGMYKMDVYRYSSWIHTTIQPGDTLINVWPVHSSSAL